jgi:cytochrome c553
MTKRFSSPVRLFLAVTFAALTIPSPGHAAGDPKAGRKKALTCQTCHGLDGVSRLPEAPNLSGQIEGYLVKALGDYKSGDRKNEMMSLIAAQLSDADMADLAAYYSAIPIEVVKRP